MATLTNCPECGGMVSTAAHACPRCGHTGPFLPAAAGPPPQERSRSSLDQYDDLIEVAGDHADDAGDEARQPAHPARKPPLRRAVITLLLVLVAIALGYANHRVMRGERTPQPDGARSFLWKLGHPRTSSASDWDQVSVGRSHTCGLNESGSVICWGYPSKKTLTKPDGSFISVSAGFNLSCGIQSDDGRVKCWEASSSPREKPTPWDRFVEVDVGRTVCGISANHLLVCWDCEQQSDHQTAPCSDVPSGRFNHISAGFGAPCAIGKRGDIVCWGDHTDHVVPDRGRYKSVASSAGNNCALNVDGTIECWGQNLQGQCEAPDGVFNEITAGYWHMCALAEGGTVDCWGCCEGDREAAKWMSGDGGSCDRGQCSPPNVTFTQISAGGETSCGVTTEGAIRCWGDNREGQASPP